MKTSAPTLSTIAARITAHLKRFEGDIDPGAGVVSDCIWVRYDRLCGVYCLTKSDALAYLAWLDAGNVGKHWEMGREDAK